MFQVSSGSCNFFLRLWVLEAARTASLLTGVDSANLCAKGKENSSPEIYSFVWCFEDGGGEWWIGEDFILSLLVSRVIFNSVHLDPIPDIVAGPPHRGGSASGASHPGPGGRV